MALNEMMHRPVVKKELVEFMRTRLKPFSGELGELEKDANTRGVPIIPHETAVFLNMILGQIKPKQILEIGAAIGFSGSLMAQHVGPEGHVTTIDRFDVMIRQAKANFEKLGVADKAYPLGRGCGGSVADPERTLRFHLYGQRKVQIL